MRSGWKSTRRALDALEELDHRGEYPAAGQAPLPGAMRCGFCPLARVPTFVLSGPFPRPAPPVPGPRGPARETGG